MTAVGPRQPDTAQPQEERGDRPAEALPEQKRSFAELLAVIRKGSPPVLITAALIVSLLEVAWTLAFPVITRDLVDGIAALDMSVAGWPRTPGYSS